MDHFSTARLNAERLQETHFDLLCRMHQDPRVMATLGGVRTAAQTRDFLDINLAHWQQHGYGLWIFTAKEDGQFAGRGGLRHVVVGGGDEIELAYALESEFWGQGYATEMAEAIVGLSAARYGLNSRVCYTRTDHLASRRVMEKAGFEFEREIVHAGQPHVLYRRKAADRTIRIVRPADLAALLELYVHLNPDNADVPDDALLQPAWERILSDPNIHCFVAETDGVLTGSCLLAVVPNLTRGARPFGVIENVVTHREYRRQGIGRRLMRHALQTAWDEGCYKVMLLSGAWREDAHRFYEELGFTQDGKIGFVALRTPSLHGV